jgi:hypothetical protein
MKPGCQQYLDILIGGNGSKLPAAGDDASRTKIRFCHFAISQNYLQKHRSGDCESFAQVVATPDSADPLFCGWTSYSIETKNPFARSLSWRPDFKDEAKAEILSLLRSVPTIVVIYWIARPSRNCCAAKALVGEYAHDTALNVLLEEPGRRASCRLSCHPMDSNKRQKKTFRMIQRITVPIWGFHVLERSLLCNGPAEE